MAFLVAFDSGTTSVRAIVFDDEGRVHGLAQKEISQIFPQPGWVEHDADEIWGAQLGVAIEALARARVRPADVAALGITNQRETVVVWERETGRPIHNAIVWQDRRTADVCARLEADGHGERVAELTGLRLDPYFSATKLAWILDHVDGARGRAERGELCFGTIDSWLAWKLSGAARLHVTDPSNASRTLLYDLHAGDWNDELLELFRVPRSLLPEVRSTSEVLGTTGTSLGLGGLPIASLVGDQQAALFGQLCLSPGQAKCTYGTGCFLLQNSGDAPRASRHRLLCSVAWQLGERREFALEGSVFVGGAAFQWLRDGLGLVGSVRELDELASSVEDARGTYFVPAFTGLGAPSWDPYARGTWIGLTRETNRAHLARATLEGVGFQVADLLEAMEADTGVPFRELRVDGGAAQSEPLLQFQADLLQIPIVRPRQLETTALGAALLAGLAVGTFADPAALATRIETERIFEPRWPRERAEHMRAGWRRALERSRGWAQETP